MELDHQADIAPLTAPQDDAADIARWVDQRDEAAMTRLIQRHGPAVVGVCRRVLRNPADAEDAAQATFIALSQEANRLREGARVAAWLHRIAVRMCIRLQRSSRRRRRHERIAAVPVTAPLPVESDVLLDDGLAALPESDRALLLAHHGDGVSVGALATAHGVAAEAMKKRLQRARERLGHWYRQHGGHVPDGVLALAATPMTAGEVGSWCRAILHPAVHATPRAVMLAQHMGRGARIGAHVAHVAAGAGLTAAGVTLVHHAGGMGAPPHHQYLSYPGLEPIWSLLVLIALVSLEEAWCWWRTKETHWAPLLLLSISALGTLIIRIILAAPVVPSSLQFDGLSIGGSMGVVTGVAFAVGGGIWVTERERNRQPLPAMTARIRALLVGAMLIQAWYGIGRYFVS